MTTTEQLELVSAKEREAYAPIQELEQKRKQLMDIWMPIYREKKKLELRLEIESEFNQPKQEGK